MKTIVLDKTAVLLDGGCAALGLPETYRGCITRVASLRFTVFTV